MYQTLIHLCLPMDGWPGWVGLRRMWLY